MASSPRLTLPVSAINAAAREDPAAVTRLTQAAERVRVAQLGGRASDLPSATDAYRTALSEMEERAVAGLEATGRRVTATVRTRIRQTLAAAAADPGDRTALRQGRLSRELAPTGFDVFGPTTRTLRLVPKPRSSPAAHPAAAATPAHPGADDARRRARQQVRLQTAAATARANLRRLETRANGLEKTATRHAQAAAAASQRADAARQAAEEAKAAVRQAQARLVAAEEAVRAFQAPA